MQRESFDELIDTMLTRAAACVFFGGPDKPIHPSTLYRGIAAGRYPGPIDIGPNIRRWSLAECAAARRKLAEGRPR